MTNEKTWIIDFDGVLANSMGLLADFLSHRFRLSRKRSLSRIFYTSLLNKPARSYFFRKIGGELYSGYIRKQILSGQIEVDSLRHGEFIEALGQLKGRKILLTSNYRSVCEIILGDLLDMFEIVETFDTTKSKTQAVNKLMESDLINLEDCIFVTDTVGDIKEFLGFTEPDKIYASTWGFNPTCLLLEHLPHQNLLLDQSQILKLQK